MNRASYFFTVPWNSGSNPTHQWYSNQWKESREILIVPINCIAIISSLVSPRGICSIVENIAQRRIQRKYRCLIYFLGKKKEGKERGRKYQRYRINSIWNEAITFLYKIRRGIRITDVRNAFKSAHCEEESE